MPSLHCKCGLVISLMIPLINFKNAYVERDARRLGLAGIQVPRNSDGTPAALVEISPRCVVDDADAVDYFRANPVADPVQPGQERAFGK